MHFHWCGDFTHDIVHNALVLFSMAPEWLPTLRMWALQKLKAHA